MLIVSIYGFITDKRLYLTYKIKIAISTIILVFNIELIPNNSIIGYLDNIIFLAMFFESIIFYRNCVDKFKERLIRGGHWKWED